MPSRTRPRGGAILSLLLLLASGGPLAAQASIAEANAKLVAKAAQKVAAAEAKVAKKEAVLAATEATLAAREDALAAEQETLTLLQDLLADAQQALDDALALPENTVEEQIAKGQAVAQASKGVAFALSQIQKSGKKIAKHEAVIAKLETQIGALETLIPLFESAVDSLQELHDLLLVPFDHVTTRSWPLHVTVSEGGQPVERARVMVLDALRPKGKLESVASAEVWWQGFTDAQGEVVADVALPAALEEVDVIVHRPGYDGPWSEPLLASRAGPLAPSARLHAAREALDELDVELTEVP